MSMTDRMFEKWTTLACRSRIHTKLGGIQILCKLLRQILKELRSINQKISLSREGQAVKNQISYEETGDLHSFINPVTGYAWIACEECLRDEPMCHGTAKCTTSTGVSGCWSGRLKPRFYPKLTYKHHPSVTSKQQGGK